MIETQRRRHFSDEKFVFWESIRVRQDDCHGTVAIIIELVQVCSDSSLICVTLC